MHLWRHFTHMAPTANPLCTGAKCHSDFSACDATSVCAKAYRAVLSHEICSIFQSVHVLLIEFIYPPIRNCFAYANDYKPTSFRSFIYFVAANFIRSIVGRKQYKCKYAAIGMPFDALCCTRIVWCNWMHANEIGFIERVAAGRTLHSTMMDTL